MNSRWQDELLALVTRYGEACAQVAAERESGRREQPAADRSGAWRAILSHLSQQAPPAGEPAGGAGGGPAAAMTAPT
ncbi:hypothetical protein [Ramlibacter sp.]|uniref:hypothetical protein n=1 Tax=Ramlibacter sp. TaxID=1917967 RepID=UPI002C708AE9|nr:hypothetical protein [Ramlibacter sp.]HWI82207.1 hypothetical protein [Ramlibacter sp.]